MGRVVNRSLGGFVVVLSLLVTVAAAIVAVGGAAPHLANASHCTTKLQTINVNADRFKNYDFTARNEAPCKVDWPVDFVFRNNASVNKVKSGLRDVGYDRSGSTMFGRVDDGRGWQWDEDSGVKNDEPCFFDAEHIRIYAPADDRLFNSEWGFYVIATSHIDHNEGCFGSWAGRSELAEARIIEDARKKWAAQDDRRDMHNGHDFRREGDHILENDGFASWVFVP